MWLEICMVVSNDKCISNQRLESIASLKFLLNFVFSNKTRIKQYFKILIPVILF